MSVSRENPSRGLSLSAGVLAIAVAVGLGVGHLGTSTMPFQVGALVDGLGLSDAQAGLFGSIQVGALALTMLLAAPALDRFSPWKLAVVGGILALAANIVLFTVTHTLALHVLSALVGVGYGLAFAASISAASAARDPDRLFAFGNGGALVLIISVMSLIPVSADYFGKASGAFMGIAALAAISIPLMIGLGRKAQRARTEPRSATPALKQAGALPLIFVWSMFSLGTGGVWAFAERIAVDIGLAPQTTAAVLSAGIFVGMGGAALATLVGGAGRGAWLTSSLLVVAASCVMLGLADGLWLYAAGIFGYWASYMFLYSLLLGTAAELDPSGKLGTIGGGAERFGYAVGAALAGLIAEYASYSAIGVLAGAGCLAGLFYGIPQVMGAVRALKQAGG